ncbi:MFS transporter [Paraconexibacter antarcticus]|uniref:MFS transporter n=1 Tax=Paraconexibacter antarcticus TaxID=2949664 RepID=A0ABY5DTR2_9ACTN|nr:MFS transporter [Paraconexibacter antarcticus]UTI63939.1 MFS transporter [Paraconexibacter antarcticus]
MSRARSVWVLTVLCGAVSLVVASITTLYVAGPEIARDVGASQTELTWMIDIYTLVMAGLLLPAGALGDRFGRRGVMIAGLAIFTAAAAVLQVVDTPSTLIATRAVLGLGAALILPSTLSLITSTFPPDFRDTAVGVWTAAFTLAGVFGGALAAILLEFFSWRSAFWSILAGAIVVLSASPSIPSSRDEQPPPMDNWGAVAALVSVSALVYGFIQAGIDGWTSPTIITALMLGVLAGAGFAAIQLRRAHPLLDVRLFANRSFAVAAFTVFVAFAAVYGLAFLIIPYQQIVLGDSALAASMPMSATAVTIIPITIFARRLTERIGLRVVVALSCLFNAAGFGILCAISVDGPVWVLYAATLVIGAGLGLGMVPCTEAILTNVEPAKQGVAASVNHTTREVGTSLGVALFGGLLSGSYAASMRHITQALPGPARDASRGSVAGALQVAQQSGPRGAELAAQARHAYVTATQHTSLVMVFIMAGAALIAALWAPPRNPRAVRAASAEHDRRPALTPVTNR